jgi:hypothetical protein
MKKSKSKSNQLDITTQLNTTGSDNAGIDTNLTEVIRLGKDEMNLAEHPFAALWKHESRDAEIYLEWQRPHPTTGKMLKASWRVVGDPKMGLPTISDERVYLVLMELTREAGFTQTVHFTRHELIKRLGWADNAKSNQMLKDAFARLTSVTVTAENSFWNPRAKSFSSAGFHMLDNFEIFAEPPGRKSPNAALPLSYFKWNDILFQSFVNGNIRSLDLTLALSLKGSIALRLFRFLDKKTYAGRHPFEISLRDLCGLHLGMAVDNCYESDLKARLKPAHEELIKIGFLKDAVYQTMKTRDGSKVRYTFPRKKALAAEKAPVNSNLFETANPSSAKVSIVETPVVETPHAQPVDELLQQMFDLKVSPDVAQEFLQSISPETIRLQLDCLDDRQPKDRAATFVKAIREGWEPPAKYFERQKAAEQPKKAREAQEAAQREKTAQEAIEREKQAIQDAEVAQLDVLWEKLDAKTRERIETQARERLGVLGQTGRAQAALVAMRRNLLREKMGL